MYSNDKKRKLTKHLKQSINRPTLNPMPIYDPEKIENLRQSITCSTEKNLHSSTSKNFEIEPLPSCSKINKCSAKERTVKETVGSDKSSPSVTLDLESIPILEIPSIKDVSNTLERIEISLDKIRRANVTTNFELKAISKRLDKLEFRQHNTEPVENDMAMIIPLLPIKTVESIKEFEDLILSNEVAASQFKKLLLKVGGNTPRINIHRALERTITNMCAVNCSWRGIRSNYKICNLTFIKIIRDVICSVHSGLTEAEFDVTSAEWFRFAKQRAAREEKRKDL
ncbi:uncharacterized protein LOC118645413 [Monomorium pharaonis]|nr:uncharacterized protein LOC118645413 [Monomorium pharaonis]